jgi:thiol:disulfide interchange protein DsbD
MGQKNADMEITRYRVNAFPYHAIIDPAGNAVGTPTGYTSNVKEFSDWLKTGLSAYDSLDLYSNK